MPPKFQREGIQSGSAERQALLEGTDDDDEDFFLRGPNAQPAKLIQEDGKISRVQSQVGEVMDSMKDNINKLLDRGDKIEELHGKSENLTENSRHFQWRAKELRRDMWWRNCRKKMVIAIVLALILLAIIVPIILHFK